MGLLTTIWIFKVAEMESETVGESNENLMMPKKTLKPKKNKQTNKQRKNGTRESGSVQIDQLRSYRPSVGATAD